MHRCNYQIINQDPDKFIEIKLSKVKLAKNRCRNHKNKKDLKINFVAADNNIVSRSYCHLNRPIYIRSRSNIEILFHSLATPGDQKNQLGYALTYEFKSAIDMCSGQNKFKIDNLKPVNIKSENFNGRAKYSRSSQCRWHFTSDDHLVLDIKRFFGEFHNSKWDDVF